MHKIIILLVCVLIGASCSNKDETETEIVIGVVLPLTGEAAQWGIPPKNGAIMAVEEINTSGGINGKKIKLVIEDSKCTPNDGVTALNKILTTDKPIAVIGDVCSSVTLAMASTLEKNGIVLISPGSTNPLISEAGDYIFRVIPSDELRGKVFAEYIFSKGYRKVAILNINNDGGNGNRETFTKHFNALGGNISTIEMYAQGATEMKTQIEKIQQSKPDAVMIVSYPEDSPILLKQFKELNFNVPSFFQTEAMDDPTVIANAGNAANGVTYILAASPEGNVVDEFKRKYQKKYNKETELYAAEGYDAIKLIASVLSASDSMTSNNIKNRLYNIKSYKGASGTISFDKYGDVVKPMAIKKIENGRKLVIKEI